MTLLIGLTVLPMLVVLVSIHELGHLLAALACRTKPLEFGIGLPPRACTTYWGRTRVNLTPDLIAGLRPGMWVRCVSRSGPDGLLTAFRIDRTVKPPPGMETAPADALIHEGKIRAIDDAGIEVSDFVISINWLPLGGFVRLAGEEHSDVPRGLSNKNWPQRMSVAMAGVIANLAIALPLLVAAQWTQAQTPALVSQVEPGSPAHRAGIKPHDRIVRIDGNRIRTARDIQRINRKTAGQKPQWTIQRADALTVTRVDHQGVAGVYFMEQPSVRPGITTAAQDGFGTYARATMYLASVPGKWIRQGETPEIAGPVAAGATVAKVSRQNGITAWLAAAAVISLSIGIINLLPLPPLDGFKMALMVLEAARRGHRLDIQKERMINRTGYAALLTLAAGFCVLETLRILI